MTAPAALESDLRQVNEEIRRLDAEADVAHQAADRIVEEMRAEGIDPLRDAEAFERVDAAYRAADELREQASVLRQRRERLLGRFDSIPTRPARRSEERRVGKECRSRGSP